MGNTTSNNGQVQPPGPRGLSSAPVSAGRFAPSDGFFISDAARNGNLEVLALFLKKNSGLVSWAPSGDLHARNTSMHATSMAPACHMAHTTPVLALPASRMFHQLQRLNSAVNRHWPETATYLTPTCACLHSQVWAVSGADLVTPWHLAAHEGHTGALQLLISASKEGALSNTFDPTRKALNQADAMGRTPLVLACRGGHFTSVELLLANGADPFTIDARGATPLHHAALAPNGGCVQLLLKQIGLWGPKGPQMAQDKQLLL